MTWTCQHGLTLAQPYQECEIARARVVVSRWGREVDATRRLIEQSAKQTIEEEQ